MTMRKHERRWVSVNMGRGNSDAEIVTYPRVCEACGMQIVFAKRTVGTGSREQGAGNTKTFPIHRDLKTREWFSHTAFCPVNGKIVQAEEAKKVLEV